MTYTIDGPSPGGTPFDDGGDYCIKNEKGQIIGEAICRVGPVDFVNARANALLWAAAPDLLEALNADDEFFTHYTECIHCGPSANFCPKAIVLCATAETKRKNAIAKARGEQ